MFKMTLGAKLFCIGLVVAGVACAASLGIIVFAF